MRRRASAIHRGRRLAALVVVVSACNNGDKTPAAAPSAAPPAGTSRPTPPATDEAETEGTTVLGGQPIVEPQVAASTLAAIGSSGLRRWIEGATGELDAGAPPCDPTAVLLTIEEFMEAASLSDPIAGELIVNLDATLGAAAEWCARGDSAAAELEYAEAQGIGEQLRERLEYLEP
jgi:hypothetical protein